VPSGALIRRLSEVLRQMPAETARATLMMRMWQRDLRMTSRFFEIHHLGHQRMELCKIRFSCAGPVDGGVLARCVTSGNSKHVLDSLQDRIVGG